MKLPVLLLFFAATVGHSPAPDLRLLTEHISEDSLRANLSFLASDALEGRSTPSKGQDVAAEFIASQFRRARLDPVDQDSYFQNAAFVQYPLEAIGTELTFEISGKTISVPASQFRLQALRSLTIERAPIVLLKKSEDLATLQDKAVWVDHALRSDERDRLLASKPLLVISLARPSKRSAGRLADVAQDANTVPTILLDPDFHQHWSSDATVTLHSPAPNLTCVTLRNVAGVLPGSDPVLKNEYLLVTAHYDHLAMKTEGTDRIFNGANDDASGTASVIELAQAIAAMPEKPRRSIVFMTFFGEELGLLGSRFYSRHPLFPLDSTIAQINIEQVGRTNPKEGFPEKTITFTGFSLTDLPAAFTAESTGVKVRSTKDSDAYFARSDNQALADVGIPATTVATAYTFSDYHQVSDEWQKIEFGNLAQVDRAIAVGVWTLANRTEEPRWNRGNPKTERYVKAYDQLHAAGAQH